MIRGFALLVLAAGAAPFSPARADDASALRRIEAAAAQERPRFGGAGLRGLPDYSPEGFSRSVASARRRLGELQTVDRAALPHDLQISYDLLQWEASRALERAPFQWLMFPYTPYEWTLTGPLVDFQKFTFASAADSTAYLRLIASYPAVIEGMKRHLAGQRARGILLPRTAAEGVRDMFASAAKAQPEASEYWPGARRLAALSQHQRESFERQLRAALTDKVGPALRSFADQFDADYLKRAPSRLGLFQYPLGRDYYRYLIRTNLTLDLSPEEIMAQSQATLDRVESDLQAIQAEAGSPLPRAAFIAELGSSADLTAATPEDVRRSFQAYVDRLAPRLPALFCRTPPFAYVIERAQPAEEAVLRFGYADMVLTPPRHFAYFFNGRRTGPGALLGAQALIYHEIAPGHYTQIATQVAAGAGTAFAPQPGRIARDVNAYQEAWGEYGATLAYEQGMFRTPQERYSRSLFNAMFPAAALVDVGMNFFGKDENWGRAVMRRYTDRSDAEIDTAIRRNTADWPAQILPYSLGVQAILRLREKARAELGDRFDLRRFHDAVLSIGAVPLPVLERHIQWFIDQERAGRAPGICPGADTP